VGPVLALVARDDDGEILRSSLAVVAMARRLGTPVAVLCGGDPDLVITGILGYYGVTRVIIAEDDEDSGDGANARGGGAGDADARGGGARDMDVWGDGVREARGSDAGDADARGVRGRDMVSLATAALVEIASREHPTAILTSCGPDARQVAARVAVRLDSGVITDAVDLVPGPGGPVAIQEAFTGSCLVGSAVRRGVPVITVRADAAVPEPAAVGEPVVVESVSVRRMRPGGVRVLSRAPKTAARRPDLTTAAVVVAGGRGVGSAAGFDLLGQVADALGGAVGGSRAAADLGWCPPQALVDQTGASVCPRLYVACGISGSVRHRAGMQDSRTIVAIDKDPAAPIFRIADFGVVGDLRRVLPALLAEIARRRGTAIGAAPALRHGGAPETLTSTRTSTRVPDPDRAARPQAAHAEARDLARVPDPDRAARPQAAHPETLDHAEA
jgi:electron transfer flavoprotein alpha subunit